MSNETEPTSFQNGISGQGSKEWIEAIQSEVSFLEENLTLGALVLTSWKESNSYLTTVIPHFRQSMFSLDHRNRDKTTVISCNYYSVEQCFQDLQNSEGWTLFQDA